MAEAKAAVDCLKGVACLNWREAEGLVIMGDSKLIV